MGYSTLYISVIIPLLIIFVLLLLLARFWCGWLCPFGFVQDLLQHLRRILKLPYKELDYSTIRFLDKTKFSILLISFLLVFMVSLPYYGLSYFQSELNTPFEQVCPARPLFVYLQQIIGWEPWSTGLPTLGILALGFFFISSFVIRKFWCRICPVGAINSPFNRYSLLTLQKDGEKCTKCRICLRSCPMDIEEIYEEKGKTNISSKECIHCYRCVELCPEEDCLSVAFLEKDIIRSKSPYRPARGLSLSRFKKANQNGLYLDSSNQLLKNEMATNQGLANFPKNSNNKINNSHAPNLFKSKYGPGGPGK